VTSAVWTASAVSGFLLGLSLIVAIGAQNAFVLRQGLRREHVFAVVAICALSDLALIALGIAGAGVVFEQLPWLVEVVRWIGAAFLLTYGALAARRAIRPSPQALVGDQGAGGGAPMTAVATCLALTWLNPHVYLDTLVLLGSVGSTHGDARWAFGAGAGVASILWFTALGFGARMLAPLFARPLAWRILDGIIALVMFAIAIALVLPALLPLLKSR
jgi:L-lysine exporter family protein LysE/ArgO